VKYLSPKKIYSLEELFTSIPHLRNPNNHEKIEKKLCGKMVLKVLEFIFLLIGAHLAILLHQNWLNFIKKYKKVLNLFV
jgi:hypothetical protein